MTTSRAQVYSSSKSRVLLKMTADQVLVSDWIAGSCHVNLSKTDSGCSRVVQKPVNSKPGLNLNPIKLFFAYNVCFVYQFFFVICNGYGTE